MNGGPRGWFVPGAHGDGSYIKSISKFPQFLGGEGAGKGVLRRNVSGRLKYRLRNSEQ